MHSIPKSHKILYAIMLVMILVLAAYRIFSYNRLEVRSDTEFIMGTDVSIKLYTKGDLQFNKVSDDIFDDIQALENAISAEKETTDIFKINSGEKVESELAVDKLSEALEISQKCDGLISPAVGALVDLWAIPDGNKAIPKESEISNALETVSNDNIIIDGNQIVLKNGAKIDLGAYGKGMACDSAKEVLEKSDISGGVVLVGGSILLYGNQPNNESYSVAVRDPAGEVSDILGILSLDKGVISTSGDYERYFEKDGRRYHHIFDLKEGYPTDNNLASVTVVCDSGVLSDALSTACFAAGLDEGMKLLEEFDAQGIFIDHDNKIYITKGLTDKFTLQNDDYKIAE